MPNDGSSLERLVHDFETRLLPEGFTVTSRERILDEDGNQIAEFDIVISGRIGSSEINWLIECRDRPSSGSAPGSWIEQLVTRRARFHFDKVFAVSTSGFSPGAIQVAEQFGIKLRTVRAVADIATDFSVQTFDYIERRIVSIGPLDIVTENSQDQRTIQTDGEWMIKSAIDADYVPIQQFILNHTEPRRELNMLVQDDVREEVVHHGIFATNDRLDIKIGDEHLLTIRLEGHIVISSLIFRGEILTVRVYAEGERVIGREAQIAFDTRRGAVRMKLQTADLEGGQTDWRIQVEGMEDGPHEKSVGISLYVA